MTEQKHQITHYQGNITFINKMILLIIIAAY